MFKDKVVFVGTTALGTREVVTTPIDALFAGVEVQATVADDLLQRDFLHAPDSRVLIEAVIVLGAGGIVTLLVGAMGLTWGGAGLVAVVVTVWVSAFRLMSGGTFLSPVYPTIGVVAAYAAMAVAHLLLERRRADREGHDRAISQRLMVQGMLSLTEVRHAETGRHSRRTRHYARVIAEQLARHEGFGAYLTPDRIAMLSGLAPLHDIGKVGVPDRLLNKPGALTEEELSEMRKHPEHGRDVILHAEQDVGVPDDVLLAMAKDIVYTHHEKWDGTGYPRGLSGRAIPLVGRLIALVDVYDAITTRRTYREPMSHEDAVAFIESGRGTHFDPEIVDAFLEVAPTLGRLMAESESTAAASTDAALP
jgi:adenylate cyclase